MRIGLSRKREAPLQWVLLHKHRLYCAYVTLLFSAAFAIWQLSPRTYEVTAIVQVKPGLYGAEGDKSPTTRSDQTIRAQVALLESENVIRKAITGVGAGTLYPNRSWTLSEPQLSYDDHAFIAAKKILNARFEPLTDLIRISFRHADPQTAVAFVQHLVAAFTERYFDLYSNSGAVTFFWAQQQSSGEAFVQASAALAEFATANNIYHVHEQQRLLLEQRSEVTSSLVGTRSDIQEKTGQVLAIPGLLSQMQPVGRLPQVTGLTRRLAQKETKSPTIEKLATDPPLLLVRVYQDTIATLVKLQTELAGLNALEASQVRTLKSVDEELSRLSVKEPEFDRLRLKVDQTKLSAEIFTRKALEEQLAQDLNAKKLSSIQVIQQATMPLTPIWPRLSILFAVAALLSILPLAVAAIYYLARSSSEPAFRLRPAPLVEPSGYEHRKAS